MVYRHLIFLLFTLLSFNSHSEVIAQLRKKFQSKNWIKDSGTCAGFPQLKTSKIHKDLCLGIVSRNFKFPRYIKTSENKIFIVDKGSDLFDRDQSVGVGELISIRIEKNKVFKEVIVKNLKSPSGLALWKNKKGKLFAYVSTSREVLKVDLETRKAQVIIKNLPHEGWHYVNSLYIYENDLYLNVGSQTDHCEFSRTTKGKCAEDGKTALIRKYKISPDGTTPRNFIVWASGLRNSMAMTMNPKSKKLWQGENGWDDIDLSKTNLSDENTPTDEINIISQAGLNFGWPYCYGQNKKTPGYKVDCSKFTAPQLILPAHSSPLDLKFSDNLLFNNLLMDNSLIVTLHGFRKNGQKLVYFEDLKKNSKFKILVDLNQSTIEKRGAVGRPVAMASWKDSLLITDDWNHSLLILVRK